MIPYSLEEEEEKLFRFSIGGGRERGRGRNSFITVSPCFGSLLGRALTRGKKNNKKDKHVCLDEKGRMKTRPDTRAKTVRRALLIFSRVHATLQPAMSVGWSVGHVLLFFMILFF